MATKKEQETNEALERIRELNEQILAAGREWGIGFLGAYEESLRSFADFQERSADRTDIEWVSRLVKAQADFTREIAKLSTAAPRDFLK
jgi:hypothetical protein